MTGMPMHAVLLAAHRAPGHSVNPFSNPCHPPETGLHHRDEWQGPLA